MANELKGLNQLHGKSFEDILKSSFSGSADAKRSHTAKFDIEDKFDSEMGIPTSIKTMKTDNIGLSDARRFFENEEPFRMLVGKYSQQGKIKSLDTLYEFILDEKALNKIKGNLNFETVKQFHEEICSFKKGEHKEARVVAKKHKKELEETSPSLVKLNPKIDSKTQRRLQCSIALKDLISAVQPENIKTHTENFNSLCLPVKIISPARIVKKNEK